MHTRRITLGLSAAAGGLLAVAFLPMAVANADTSDVSVPITPSPDVFGFAPYSPETVLTVSGLPPFDQQVEGYQTLDYFSPATATDPIGTVNADVSTLSLPDGFTNTEYLITGPGSTLVGVGPNLTEANLPTTGSVYDIANFGDGFQNDYSDVVTPRVFDATTDALSGTGTAATGTITDTFVTPFGDFDLTPLVDSFSTAVNPFDNFLTTVDPGSIGDLGSILGSFGDLIAY